MAHIQPHFQTYLVGGAVRDRLLNLVVKDRDWVVVGATAEHLLKCGYRQVGQDFPVFLHPQSKEEYALARTESKRGHGYQGFAVNFTPNITLEQDLLRRDLTINAIAQDPNGELYDPYGGISDLHQRILRHVSPAFSEDPLRVLRTARFHARFAHLGFQIAAETQILMRQITASGELLHLSAERIWLETQKALATDSPHVYFQTLRQCGALAVLFPEIDTLFSVLKSSSPHPDIDSGTHTLMALKQAAKLTQHSPHATVIRFATLCHDLGSDRSINHHLSTDEHNACHILIQQFCQRLKIPNNCRDLAILSCRYHSSIHQIATTEAHDIVHLFDSLEVWRKPNNLHNLLTVCAACYHGYSQFEQCDYPQAQIALYYYQNALKADVQQIIAAGYQNQQIRKQLTLRRIELVRQQQTKLAHTAMDNDPISQHNTTQIKNR